MLGSFQGKKVRGLVLINPQNPLGDVYSQDSMMEYLEFAKKYDFLPLEMKSVRRVPITHSQGVRTGNNILETLSLRSELHSYGQLTEMDMKEKAPACSLLHTLPLPFQPLPVCTYPPNSHTPLLFPTPCSISSSCIHFPNSLA